MTQPLREHIPDDCPHVWVSNSGRGGPPKFRDRPEIASDPVMHVLCQSCGARTWLTRQRWNELLRADASG